MQQERINADFSRRIVIQTGGLPWIPSPLAGVERRMLDRIGGEVARATSLVRYAPGSVFSAHAHALGEEFIVLDGVFSDEHGDYPKDTYIRNPPGSHHSPRTAGGCTIFVKLRQMPPTERERVVVDTTTSIWKPSGMSGHTRLVLYASAETGEEVAMEKLEADSSTPEPDCPGGEEIFVLNGDLTDETGTHVANTWVRNPAGYRRNLRSTGGAIFWSKRGHLREA
jgi:anti-sigma factor ChrR (cupin superfamily)